MKQAEVVPIFKKGKRDDAGNYRPGSLTSVCGKIMEKIISNEIVDHLERNEVIRARIHEPVIRRYDRS